MMNSAPQSSDNKTLRFLAIVMLAVALLGFTDATYLAVKHYQGLSPVCFITSGCDTVTTSVYSTILGVPVALVGALYYGAMILGIVAYFDGKSERLFRALSLFTIAGLLASIWFMGLQLFVIRALCIYCIVSATTSTLLFILGLIILFRFNRQPPLPLPSQGGVGGGQGVTTKIMKDKLHFLLRLAMGWLFLYAGLTKVLNPNWTSAGYLKGAKSLTWLYQWFASPQNIGWVDFLNEWGLTLVGAALILGLATRFASYAGALLMALYYFPVAAFPIVGEHSYIVDEHVIYFIALLLLAWEGTGRFWGLDNVLRGSALTRSKWTRWMFS